MIDAYIDELGRSLRGPRRAKADLLAEARDALVDAAEAYECDGLARQAAEVRAVAEFGDVVEIGPDYQAELGFSQGRRTALVLFFVLVGQSVAWRTVWPMIRPGPVGDPTPAATALGQVFGWLGGIALVGALAATLACGVGVRRLGSRVIRVVGGFALAVAGGLTGLSLVLAAVAPRPGSLLSLSVGLPWSVAFLVMPMAAVAVSGYRCLVATPTRT